ncbi:MAG: AraC family transcriptional regulator [Cyclobacteriaceae bacterium]|nr:helix-turn-helix transcriptional regulator [Cyclobacteriaceae bacterium]
MHTAPTISMDEFVHYTTGKSEADGFQEVERAHPDFGIWKEKFLDLGHIRVYEHRVNLDKEVNVLFDDGTVDKYVHHCMSVEGNIAANFRDYNISAALSPKSFHNIFLPGEEYYLSLGKQFINVHIEVERSYYLGLLDDNECWSAELKERILNNLVYYPGEFKLSLPMLQTIHQIFNSSMSGSLKKLLIEAKVHELLALQLHSSIASINSGVKRNTDIELFHAIKEYLDKTFLHDHSLKNIARHFAINEFSLKKGFRELTGTSVFDYLLNKRLEYSLQLLQNTEQSITSIGSTVGYKYPNHFSSAFKKKFGYNPANLRK